MLGIRIEYGKGNTLFVDQVSKEGAVILSRWDGENLRYERTIPANDMLLLFNLYADIKDHDIRNCYLNPEGKNIEE